ncbi:MAG: hypothetical protein P8171_21300 [Candidatus Thiodiazotropha sp.]
MHHLVKFILLSLVFFSYMEYCFSTTVDTIDSQGVYVVTANGFVKVEPYSHDYRFVDLNHINEIPFVARNSDTLQLVVYEKDFQPNTIELELRPLDIKVKLEKVRFNVKPMKQADMYKLTAKTPISDGAMLHVKSWSHFDNMGVIMLGDTHDELVKFFSRKAMKSAPTVKQYLDDALVAFPDSAELKSLSSYWKAAAEKEKEMADYAYVEDKWQQYENADKLTLKSRYLEALIVEINGYLNAHPNGVKSEEAKRRKATAKQKLEEYEKLL